MDKTLISYFPSVCVILKIPSLHATRPAMNEIIQEILKKYGDYPSGQFPHIEWLKKRLLELDDEIEEIQEDRNRLLSELCNRAY